MPGLRAGIWKIAEHTAMRSVCPASQARTVAASDPEASAAYTDRSGGVCPMLAAHRCGGRTSLISFAHAWDGFAQAKRARRATERELRILTTHLEASLLNEELPELDRAMVEHREAIETGAGEHATIRRARPGEP